MKFLPLVLNNNIKIPAICKKVPIDWLYDKTVFYVMFKQILKHNNHDDIFYSSWLVKWHKYWIKFNGGNMLFDVTWQIEEGLFKSWISGGGRILNQYWFWKRNIYKTCLIYILYCKQKNHNFEKRNSMKVLAISAQVILPIQVTISLRNAFTLSKLTKYKRTIISPTKSK